MGNKFRIRLKSSWRGKLDSTDPECEEKQYAAAQEIDVDAKTCQALVYQHLKAELVSVEEIEKKAIEKAAPTKTPKSRASNVKGGKKK